ncbi:MAG: alpha/beta hydrolase [Alkalinema sp. RU_4_3]|nr:alpha/beta hydrolase [Alkalinema sp. RU_4_3]
MRLPLRLLQSFVFLSFSSASLCLSASAAEQVIIKYKIFRESISVAELTTFVETGETSSALQSYLNRSGQKPEDVRRTLGKQVDVNVVTLDRALNNRVGNLVLDQISLAVHPPTNAASRQAIRSALVLSASQDNKISLIEVIQKYPTSEVELEGERISQAYRQISALGGLIDSLPKL